MIIQGSPWLLQVLETVRALGLPDWYLAAGAIRDTVWDALHGSVSLTPYSDLDVIYFVAANSPNDAERTFRSVRQVSPEK